MGLKPKSFCYCCGTSELVPCYKSCWFGVFSQAVKSCPDTKPEVGSRNGSRGYPGPGRGSNYVENQATGAFASCCGVNLASRAGFLVSGVRGFSASCEVVG